MILKNKEKRKKSKNKKRKYTSLIIKTQRTT